MLLSKMLLCLTDAVCSTFLYEESEDNSSLSISIIYVVKNCMENFFLQIKILELYLSFARTKLIRKVAGLPFPQSFSQNNVLFI